MSDEHEGNEPEGTEEEKETGAKPELGEAGKRALNAERKARQSAEKRLKELEAKVKESEDAEKTEVERLKGQVDDLTKQAAEATARADRFEVAADKGLSLAQARRLVGATKEELEEDADAMRAELGLDKDETGTETDEKDEHGEDTPLGQRPKENLKSGASNEDDEQPDAGKLADSILSSGW